MLSDWLLRARALFRPTSVEHELDDELRFHLERHVERLVERGLDRNEAERRVRLAFGGLDQIKDECRDARGVAPLEGFAGDLRDAARGLARQPTFAVIVVATLALGIGANTAIYSILDSLILRTLPVSDPAGLVQITREGAFRRTSWPNPIWESLRDRDDLFAGALAYSSDQFNLSHAGEADPVSGLWVSGGFFDVLGVHALVGRTLNAADDVHGGGRDGPVAGGSFGLWERRLRGAAETAGGALRPHGVPRPHLSR